MKKFMQSRNIIAFMLMAFISIQVSAQSLIGKWKSSETRDDETIICNLTFSKGDYIDVKLNFIGVNELDDKKTMRMEILFKTYGTYDIKSDTIVAIKFNTKAATAEITKMEIEGLTQEQNDAFKTLLLSQFNLEEMTEKAMQEFPKKYENIEYSIEGDSLTIFNKNFVRVKE